MAKRELEMSLERSENIKYFYEAEAWEGNEAYDAEK